MRTIPFLLALTACALVFAASDAAAAGRATLVVDDDGEQCPNAGYTSIQEALGSEAAKPYVKIRVCPGVYRETVVVEKPLRLQGPIGAVDAVDCFAQTPPDLTAGEYAIVDPPVASAPAFALVAPNVRVSGFAIRGRLVGMTTSDAYSGYRIHHNLFAANREGVRLGTGAHADSRRQSRFDHNCLRENSWGLSNTSVGALINARIDHNETYRTLQRAFEALHVAEDVRFDHNTSRLDTNAYLVSGSKRSKIVENTLDRVRIGMEIGRLRPNEDLEVAGNSFFNVHTGPQPATAIGFNPPSNGGPNTGVVVSANTITGYTTGIAIGGPPGAVGGSLTESEIVANTIDNSIQNGIRMRALNTAITVRENSLNANGWHGIHAMCGLLSGTTIEVCPTGNTFVANEMLGNGLYDARDDTGIGPGGAPRPLQNTWIANRCVKDLPEAMICPTG